MADKKGTSNRTWGAISAGAFLLSIALAIILYVVTGDPLTALWTILIVFGIYMAVTAPLRSKGGDGAFGPSAADASVAGGILLAGVGATGFVYDYCQDVLITVAVFIVIVAVVGIVMAIKNRGA